MALNPSIILAGQQFDLAGSMGAGNQLAAQTNQLRDQNALRDVYRTQGAGILQGNQQSLNALAAVDPNLAINAQGGVLQNQTAARSFEIMNAQEKRAIAEAARNMDEAQKAQAAAAVKQEVLRFISAPTPEIFDQMVTQAGKPELAGMWENRQVLGAEYVSSVEEALKLSQGPSGPEPMSPEGKLAMDIRNGIVQPGAASAGGDNQTERDIALLGEIGIPRQEAIRITQLYVVSRDPVTGEQVLIDKRTGRPVDLPQATPAQAPAAGQPAPVAPPAAPPAQAPLTFGNQYQNAPNVFGMEGFAKNLANTATDVIPGIGTAFPEEQQTSSDFRVLRESLINDVASAYPRQPPSWLLQNIQELTPLPGSVFEGPDAAAAKLRSLGGSLAGELRVAETQLSTRINPTMRQELEMRKIGIEAALSRITTALNALEPQGSATGNKTSSGVTWSIEE